MDRKTFAELRELAANKRDEAVRVAEAEYAAALQRIASLECNLFDDSRKPVRRLGDSINGLIMEVVPTDSVFTVDQIVGLIRTVHPNRRFKKRTVQLNIGQLCTNGTLKLVTPSRGPRPATYALAGLDVAIEPPQRSYGDWAEFILRRANRPMRAIEILMGMRDAGFTPPDGRERAMRNLVRALQRDSKRFVVDNADWRLR